jgi:hypothetical protein
MALFLDRFLIGVFGELPGQAGFGLNRTSILDKIIGIDTMTFLEYLEALKKKAISDKKKMKELIRNLESDRRSARKDADKSQFMLAINLLKEFVKRVGFATPEEAEDLNQKLSHLPRVGSQRTVRTDRSHYIPNESNQDKLRNYYTYVAISPSKSGKKLIKIKIFRYADDVCDWSRRYRKPKLSAQIDTKARTTTLTYLDLIELKFDNKTTLLISAEMLRKPAKEKNHHTFFAYLVDIGSEIDEEIHQKADEDARKWLIDGLIAERKRLAERFK